MVILLKVIIENCPCFNSPQWLSTLSAHARDGYRSRSVCYVILSFVVSWLVVW